MTNPVCVVGLGNPGSRYEDTPHNIGFLVVDELARRRSVHLSKGEGNAQVATAPGIILVKPQTFMNLSGSAVAEVLRYRRLTPNDLIVVHDELDLPWLALRIKKEGSAAGHNGVKSIIGTLNTNVFTRVRVGIHPGELKQSVVDYVLAPWRREMSKDVDEVVSYTADAVESIVAEGVEKAMAKFNRRAGSIQNEDK